MQKSNIWRDSVAIITGGGSGIGRALAKALSKRGTIVMVTDIDPLKAKEVATECGQAARSFSLDVRDAKAVTQLIQNIANEYGHLDFLFNNAGIAVAGETFEMDASLWDRIVDINIKGVQNGVLAAYPIMVKQRKGYIINTASLAGLGPAPLMTPYAMTKHAVVGLTNSLRIEAEAWGVQVNVLCPSAIETPLLHSTNPTDLPEVPWTPDAVRYLSNLAAKPYPVEKMAEEALNAIEKNKAVIVIPGKARTAWLLGRLFPNQVAKLVHKALKIERDARKSL